MNSMIWELYKDITNEVPYNENEACICIELNITFPNIETALEFGNTLKNNKKNCKTDDNRRSRGNLLEILNQTSNRKRFAGYHWKYTNK